jgi:hypothetical protein
VKLENKKLKIHILLIAALIVTSGIFVIWTNVDPKNTNLGEAERLFPLIRPAFSASVTIMSTTLDQEAGMAIWLHTSPFQSLDAAKNALNIENSTSEYVVGSLDMQKAYSGMLGVSYPNSPSDDDPHCFVHISGWIVVYYLKVNLAKPSSTEGWLGKMMVLSSSDWYNDVTYTLNDNLLHKALVYISSLMQISDTSGAQYYHFQYPLATTLQIAIKTSVSDVYSGYTKTFNINIPNGTIVDEQSWSFYAQYDRHSGFQIDTTAIVNRCIAGRYYYDLIGTNSTLLAPNTGWHTISIWTDGNSGKATVCLLVLYH